MNNKIVWLRVSYWLGALADGLAAVLMLMPRLSARLSGRPDFSPGPDYLFAMRLGAALMLGWTLLLLWADRQPLARRGVLLLTDLVVVGLGLAYLSAYRLGFLPLRAIAPVWLFQLALLAVFSYSYYNAGRAAAGN